MNVIAQNAGASSAFLAPSELDEFLFAPVIDDTNGMTVSVLSMLARAGVDPRSKAAELARLTAGKATEALKPLIGESFQGVSRDDIQTIAARLAALLPRRAIAISAPGQTKIGNTDLTQAHAVGIAAILICFLIGAIWVTASRPSLAHVDEAIPTASGTVAAPAPPPHPAP